MLKCFFLALLALTGCTQEINLEESDMRGDGRILDRPQSSLLGKAIQIVPSLTTVASTQFVQDFPLIEVTGQTLNNAELITIALDSFQSTAAVVPLPTQVILQGLIRFGTGGTPGFGQPQDAPPVPFGGATTKPTSLILFDVQFGTQITVPASSFSLALRYKAVRNAGFAVGVVPGPNYVVNAAMAYGSKTNTQSVTETEVIPILAAGANGVINKAPFAHSLRITWAEFVGAPGAATPALLDFFGTGGAIWSMTLANTLPLPEMPWPPGAVALSITNQAAVQMTSIEVIQTLSL